LRITPVFALLISLFLLSANAQTPTLVFVAPDFPPFNVDQHGGAAGPFADIVNAVCIRIHSDCRIKTLPWRRATAEVEEGRLSGGFPLLRFPEREQIFYFMGPICDTDYAIVAGKDNTFEFHEPKDLSGHLIGVYGPSGTSHVLDRTISGVPSVNIEVELNNLTVLKKLSVGRYGAKGLGLINRDVAQYLIAQYHVENVHFAGDVQRGKYYIGLSRKSVSPEVVVRFGQALAELKQSGELAALLKKYKLTPSE